MEVPGSKAFTIHLDMRAVMASAGLIRLIPPFFLVWQHCNQETFSRDRLAVPDKK
jgi:hypothetical protein